MHKVTRILNAIDQGDRRIAEQLLPLGLAAKDRARKLDQPRELVRSHRLKISCTICVILLAAFVDFASGLCPGWAIADDWPMFGRDQTHNAVSLEKSVPTDWDVGTYNEQAGT
jgi:hypothetical protein